MTRVNYAAEATCPLLGPSLFVWVQGCPRRCPGCFNQDTLDFKGLATSMSTEQLVEQWSGVDGNLVLSGGEPFSHSGDLARLCRAIRDLDITVEILCYTGFRLDALLATAKPDDMALLRYLDVLVDGPFVASLPTDMPLKGSANQRVFLLGDRVTPDRLDALGRARVEATIAANGAMTLLGTGSGDMGEIVRQAERLGLRFAS